MLPLIKFGILSIPSYGVCMAIGIIVAFLISYARIRKRGETIDSLLMVGAVSMALALTGARVAFYIASYGLHRLIGEITSGDFSGFENGGLVFYGGLIGGVIGAILSIRLNKYNFNTFSYAIVPCIPLGHAFGRIGCLLAGCCYGLPYEGKLAIHSACIDPSVMVFPIQAVEAILNILIFLILIRYTKDHQNGFTILSLYFLLYSLMRFVLEFFRGDSVRGIWLGFSTSQWISCVLGIVSLLVLLNHATRFGKLHQAN